MKSEYIIDLLVNVEEETGDELNLIVPSILENVIPEIDVVSINAYPNRGEI